ncbi:MAG: hypothetical protein R2932_02875 [Caldilineaceae bacterium]
MLRLRCFPWLLVVLLTGCALRMPSRSSDATATAAPVPTATALAAVEPAVQPVLPARNDATEDNDTTGDNALLRSPSVLYLYASTYPDSRQPGLLWYYDPNAALPLIQVMTDTTATESITAAALAPGTGTLAWGTTDGGLYLIEAGATSQHIWQSSEVAAPSEPLPVAPPYVNHLAWSADGTQLAFAVRHERTSGAADNRFDELAGLWLWQRASGESTQIWASPTGHPTRSISPTLPGRRPLIRWPLRSPTIITCTGNSPTTVSNR